MDKNQDLIDGLEELKAAGAIEDYQRSSSGSGELTWNLGLELPGLKTREVKAFLAGVRVGRTLKPASTPRGSKYAGLRKAIAEDGRVEIDVDMGDPSAVRTARNNLFTQAYALGLKGQFKVETKDGKLVGTVVK